MPARDHLHGEFTGFPGLGAMYEIIPNQPLRDFMSGFSLIADKVFGKALALSMDPNLKIKNEIEEPITLGSLLESAAKIENGLPEGYDSKNYYKTFNVQRMSVTVFEMHTSAKAARVIRSVWEKNDMGAVEKNVKNDLGRRFPDQKPKLAFKGVLNAGRGLQNAPQSDIRQKLALLPDPTKYFDTYELLSDAPFIMTREIARRMRHKRISIPPPTDFVPHLTFAAFRRNAHPTEIVKVIKQSEALIDSMPFEVMLGKLVFRSKLERRFDQ